GISRTHFENIHRYWYFHNLRLVWGEDLKHVREIISGNEGKLIKIQIALEYLLENYINLTIQKKYRVFKLRSLFQNLKAIKYDLEFLGVTSGKLYSMILQLINWLNCWFESPLEPLELLDWIDKFYDELASALSTFLNQTPIYIPPWGNCKLSRNISIKLNQNLSFKYAGICLPRPLLAVSKKTFNLNTRINSFTFFVPFNSDPRNRTLEERFVFFRQIKEYGKKYFPDYLPVISSFAHKIV
ncbi:MAG: hypothetical protein QW279_13015, partial [Candidatus Jordarchaeaceae archaeon]